MSSNMTKQTPHGIDAVLGKLTVTPISPPAAPATSAEQLVRIDINLLDPSPDQPREAMPEEHIADLAENIKTHKLLQPIVARAIGGRFQIVVGHCRTEAYRRLRDAATTEAERGEWSAILARLVEVSDEQACMLTLSENIAREDLNPVEEGAAYAKMIDKYGYTNAKALAERLQIDAQRVTRRLRLHQAPPVLRQAIAHGIRLEPQGESGRRETRKLHLADALELLRLYAHLMKKFPGVEPRKAAPRPIADLKLEPVVSRALSEGWSREKTRAYVDAAIAGRTPQPAPDEAAAAPQPPRPPVERTAARIVVHLDRLRGATADQIEAVVREVREAVRGPAQRAS